MVLLISLEYYVNIMTVVSVTMPHDLLERFDRFSKARGYYSRSEAFRDAIRSIMTEAELVRDPEETTAAILMITCDYERKDVDLRLTELRHEFDDIIVENIHRHIRDEHCLEIFIAEGEHQDILQLVGRVRGMRGIREVQAMFMKLVGKEPLDNRSRVDIR